MKALSDLQTQQIKKLALASEEAMALMKKTQQLAEEVRSMTHAPCCPRLLSLSLCLSCHLAIAACCMPRCICKGH